MILGSDISKWQAAYPHLYAEPVNLAARAFSGLTFVICRATHDAGSVDGKFSSHFAAAAGHPYRGAYHWCTPGVSSPEQQAAAFADVCLKAGFRPGLDLWMADCEDASFPADGRSWVDRFMYESLQRLGSRAFLYTGWWFATSHLGGAHAAQFLARYNWWLPAYGPNDGHIHDYVAPFTPVVHQYTSLGGPGHTSLDMNVVTDEARWASIVGSAPQPQPEPPASPPEYVYGPDVSEDDVKQYTVKGVHLDGHGNGYVQLPKGDLLGSPAVRGGSRPDKVGRYDKTPVVRVSADSALLVISGGEPHGTYDLTGYVK